MTAVGTNGNEHVEDDKGEDEVEHVEDDKDEDEDADEDHSLGDRAQCWILQMINQHHRITRKPGGK